MKLLIAGLLLLAVLAAPPLRAEGDVKVPEGMTYVPAGKFVMGRDAMEGEKPTEDTPRHEVVLKPYFIGLYEVSNREFARFLEAKGYEKKEHWSKEGWAWLEKAGRKAPFGWEQLGKELGAEFPSHPVVGVSWFEAEAYAGWAGRRLPQRD